MPVFGNVKIMAAFLLLLLSFCAGVREASAQTVKFPVTIDYGLLQTLIQRNAYTEANQTATLLKGSNGCLFLALSKPAVSEANGLIRFETHVTVRAGTPLGDKCLVPVSWQGYLVLNQRPVIDQKTLKLSFATTSSAVLDMNRRPAKIAEVIWNLIKSRVFSYIENIAIDLGPPVNDLKTFLLPLFPSSVQQQTQAMLRTLRSGETQVTPKAVIVDLLADVQEVYKAGEVPQKEALTGKALDDMVGVWEQWDAMLSFLVSIMSKNVLTEQERQTLMDVLLETRYAFVEGLSSQNLSQDFVREQFVRDWRRLSSIFRNHLGRNPDEQSLGYLSFFTSADALSVLDSLGPTFGIEMSRDGLVRMARMLTSDQSILNYSSGVNPDLRKLFQLLPTPQIESKEPPVDTVARPDGPEDRKIEERPISSEESGDQKGTIDQGKQGVQGEGLKNGAHRVSPDKTIKPTSPDQGKTLPERPVEREIKMEDLPKQRLEAKPVSGEKDTMSQPAGHEDKGELDKLIKQIKEGSRDDSQKSGTEAAPPDKALKTVPPDQGRKVVPDKPVERDIKLQEPPKQQNEAKPASDGKETQSPPPTGPVDKGEMDRLINQIKQGARDDGGKPAAEPAPPDKALKTAPPDQGHKVDPDKPVEQDIDVDNAFKLPDAKKPSGQADGKKENLNNSDSKGDKGLPVDQGKKAPEPDQKMKSSTPDLKHQEGKPAKQETDDDPFNIQDKDTPVDKSGAPQEIDNKDKQTRAVQMPLGVMIWDFLFPPAYAGEVAKHDALLWKVPDSGVDQYVKRVTDVLNKTTQAVISRSEFPASLQGIYRSMIIAMAWQESCYRQFIEKDHQLTYLLSYNNSSVGLMQVNERIWRGIYDREKLRWDIEYNAAAGNEIAFLYLQKYALRDKKAAKKMDQTTVARLVYAMYNGGPGQYHDFLERSRKGKMLSSDDLFWEKHTLVTSGKWEKLSQCLSRD